MHQALPGRAACGGDAGGLSPSGSSWGVSAGGGCSERLCASFPSRQEDFCRCARISWVCDGAAAPALRSGWAVLGWEVVWSAGADAGVVFAGGNLSSAFIREALCAQAGRDEFMSRWARS